MTENQESEGLDSICEEAYGGHLKGREALARWQSKLGENPFELHQDLQHSVGMYFPDNQSLVQRLSKLGSRIPSLESAASENDFRLNLPRLEPYDGIGRRVEQIIHHPSYDECGNIIYGTSMMKIMSEPGGLLESLCHFYLTSMAGEAGHNCPVACTAGILRIFQKTPDFPGKEAFLEKLLNPSFRDNYTGAQFLTEVQGGSDVGLNAVLAKEEDGIWKISGEKWFCSNANADLILLTARFDENREGTGGLGLFLVPRHLKDGSLNRYTLRRLKEKLGTRSMASGEIDFREAEAIAMGEISDGFKMVMEHVLNLSRIYNTFTVSAMARRAYQVARAYALERVAFGKPILEYPLVQETLATIRCENTAIQAAAFHLTHLQDELDLSEESSEVSKKKKLLARLLTNAIKYISSSWSVGHIRQSIEVLGGNGAIESFSTLPRLFRDSIVCENWEGTHNTLRAQVLRDILRYRIHEHFFTHISQLIAKQPGIPEADTLEKLLEEAQTEVQELCDHNPAQQSLQIREVLDKFCILFLGTALAVEALDQMSQGIHTKNDCLHLFLMLHAQKSSEILDRDRLELITAIA